MANRIVLKALALAATAAMTISANGNWNTTVVQTDAGHRIGNPEAKVKLVEFISYTCPHCARFAVEGEGPLKLAYIGTGKVNVEVRHIVRDPVDLTATMLAHCGPAAKFPLNHAAFMHSQKDWLPTANKRTAGQMQRWTSGDHAARRRAIATDLGFYKIMERRGYRRTETDKCLNDNAMAQKLSQATVANGTDYGVSGTPSFALNGITLAATHDWKSLAPQIDARLK